MMSRRLKTERSREYWFEIPRDYVDNTYRQIAFTVSIAKSGVLLRSAVVLALAFSMFLWASAATPAFGNQG